MSTKIKLDRNIKDVNITSPADKSILNYDSSSDSWVDTVNPVLNTLSISKIEHTNSFFKRRSYGNNGVCEIFLTGITLTAGTTTTIDTGVDLTTMGTSVRGGYKAFGIILGDDTSSNAHNAVFECSFRYANNVASSQRGCFLQATSSAFFNAITMDSNGTDILIKITSTSTVNLVQVCIWAIIAKQAL